MPRAGVVLAVPVDAVLVDFALQMFLRLGVVPRSRPVFDVDAFSVDGVRPCVVVPSLQVVLV